ncbi:hypothetical protein [Rhodanobacter sp. DHG33]|uniref:hypothetical protein n=1 Tax=Rhodanobacter sp. DHG33 TaxID=2775921 RepID=UPI001781FD56|nr:hypothetical protein [Rhodanobacter sp. DHG33]MBD8899909.1 hypothetical protein [Rhodanobacter sp. DHG33]
MRHENFRCGTRAATQISGPDRKHLMGSDGAGTVVRSLVQRLKPAAGAPTTIATAHFFT